MSQRLRLATFNFENLFTRAKVLNLADHESATSILAQIADLEALLSKARYTDADKDAILEKATALAPYIVIREDRAKLFSGTQSARRVVASGAEDWDGTVEVKRAAIPDMARASTAEVVRALQADVLCAVEVEDRITLGEFNRQMLRKQRFKYPFLIDGNDRRGIDVGLLSNFPLRGIRTHIFDQDRSGTVFSRDCLEVELGLPDGRALHVLCNHFKSKGGGPSQGDAKRLRQARCVAEILARYNLATDLVVVAGDLNDTPDSKPLAPLLGLPRLHDVLALQFPGRPQDRWTYAYGSQRHQIDYLLVSDPLKAAFKGAEIERRGLHDLRRLTGASPFPSVTSPANAASDHCAIVAEFEV